MNKGGVLAFVLGSGCYVGVAGGPSADVDPAAEDPGGVWDGGHGESGDESGGEPADPEVSVGAYRMMRLTRSEYDNTVRDLLGDDTAPASGFPPDEAVGPFDANVLAPPSEVILQHYMDAAESLAATAIEDLPALTGCDVDELGSDGCARDFIDRFGSRAYRRPLTEKERDRLFATYEEGTALADFAHGIELVVRAALQSPHFLYRIERGELDADAGVVRLTGWEVASRLSYFLLDSMPDEGLFAAAERGDLDDAAGLEKQARRLLDSPAAEPTVAMFHTQLMGLGPMIYKDPVAFPEFDDGLAQSMREEVGRFAVDVVLHGDGSVATLLTSPHSFVDANLAAVYGVEHTGTTPDQFVRVELDPKRRAGLLTQPGMLAATSHSDATSAVLRGRFVRTMLLCQPPPPPPGDVDNTPPESDPDASIREQLESLTGGAQCATCHVLMNPLGFALDPFDPIGRSREEDRNGFAIDPSGALVGVDGGGDFDGLVELAALLAASEDTTRCFARQWFRFGLGRPEDPELDAASLDLLDEAAFSADIREIIVALVTTDAFRFRPVESEGTPDGGRHSALSKGRWGT